MNKIDISELNETDRKMILEIIEVFKKKAYLEKALKELSKCI